MSSPPLPAQVDRRRTQPHPGQPAPVVRFEPRSRAASEPRTPLPAPEPRERPVPARVTLDEAQRAVGNAQHRDQIADAVLAFAEGRLAAAALFIVRGQSAIGWRGIAADQRRLHGSAIESLAVPLGGASVLQVAFDTGQVFRGASPAAGRPIERKVCDVLGVKDLPDEMLVVPIRVSQRIVNLLYGHGWGRVVPEDAARDLADLADRAGEAYARLIQAARIDRLVR
jgi:hypothetical protein